MKAGNILPKRFLSYWVALDFGCTGTVLILSVDDQFGAPLHTAHTVADTGTPYTTNLHVFLRPWVGSMNIIRIKNPRANESH